MNYYYINNNKNNIMNFNLLHNNNIIYYIFFQICIKLDIFYNEYIVFGNKLLFLNLIYYLLITILF